MEMSNNLTLWQQEFLGFFEDKYINNAEEKFKFNGIPIAVLYEQIYSETSLLIKQIMERVKDNKIDEMVISLDDYVIPAFIEKYKKEVWVDKEADGNVVKYSFGKKYITAAMNYQVELYDQDNLNDSINGTNRNINYIYGTDELPQMIYSRDLTRRKGFCY